MSVIGFGSKNWTNLQESQIQAKNAATIKSVPCSVSDPAQSALFVLSQSMDIQALSEIP